MKRAACAAVLLALVNGVGLVAVEADEPLANVKQELKQLQTDSSAQKSGVTDPKLKSALPPVLLQPQTTTVPTEPGSARKRQSEKQQKKQQDAEKNWLIREYESLESEGDATRRDDKQNLPQTLNEEKSDEALLQDRLSANDPKSRERREDRRSGGESLRAPDPFAPFMKDWLASSAASGPAYDAFTKASGSPSAAPGYLPAGSDASSASRAGGIGTGMRDLSTADPRRDQAGLSASGPNPFLSGLDLPNAAGTVPAPRQGPVADALMPTSIPPSKAPMALPNDPLEPSRRNSVATPASKQTEDKKYFPQQKRF